MKIGVLAAQGAFAEHIAVLQKLQVEALPVRLPAELKGLDGLVIPGGESTTICGLLEDYGLTDVLRAKIIEGLPVMGTCAGLIVLSKTITSDRKAVPLGVMNITVRRNAFGRQLESFETDVVIPAIGKKPFPAVFIRAPLIESVSGRTEVLARLPDGRIIAAREGKILVTSFHPELTDDLRFHRFFLDIVAGEK